jgi:hypothetical protein
MKSHGQEYDYRFFPFLHKKWSNVIHATAYLDIADEVPHRSEGEAVLLEHVPINAKILGTVYFSHKLQRIFCRHFHLL